MYTFGSFMALIILAEIGVGTTVYLYKDEAEQTITMAMKDGMHNYRPDSIDYQGVTKTWDALQQGYQCCGIDTYVDWKNATEFSQGRDVPDSCCTNEFVRCGEDALTNEGKNVYKTGCFKKFTNDLEENAALAGGVGAALGLIQIITCIIAFVLGRKMRKSCSFTNIPSQL